MASSFSVSPLGPIGREGVLFAFWALASAMVIAGGIALTWQAANHLLRQDLRADALEWGRYLRDHVDGLEDIVTTGELPDSSFETFAAAAELGGIFNYNLFDETGQVVFRSSIAMDGGPPGSHHRPGHDLEMVRKVMSEQEAVVELSDREERPGWPALFGVVYLPVMVDGVPRGVIEIYVDQSAKGERYHREFIFFATGLALLILLAATLPAVLVWRKTLERRRAEQRLQEMAHHDPLTKLANRADFRRRLEHALGRLGRELPMIALFWIDLDRFKTINDALGHPVGDELLCQVAARLKQCLRVDDTVARLGGDEFAILLTAGRHRNQAAALARRLVERLAEPFHIGGHYVAVGASIGVVLAPDDGIDADDLLKKADIALYRAKDAGRSTFRFFEREMEVELKARHALEKDLRQAIATDGLTLHYQPQVALDDHRVLGFEALLRWYHPRYGHMPAAEVIALAEETGLILPLGAWALRQACATAMTWPANGQGGAKVAVNLSPVQFQQPDLVALVAHVLEETGLQPQRLDLEVTETIVMAESGMAVDKLKKLKRLGVQISMDDFGTGFSSLSRLRHLPFDRVKIDRSFVKGLGADRDDMAIVHAIVTLGRSLGMEVIAEGVETEAQLAHLRLEECHAAQGYLFGRPMPASEIDRQLALSGSIDEVGMPSAWRRPERAGARLMPLRASVG
jgi:diguanylate cyclase (GGDEF)-like protein